MPAYVLKYTSGGLWYQKFEIAKNRLVYRAFDKDGKVYCRLAIKQ
jgi:hypothetical protein